VRRLHYDESTHERALQDRLLRAHRGDELCAPLALKQTYRAMADLRKSRAFGKRIYPDILGVEAGRDRLALMELKHPNAWKTGHSALYQVLAYAGHFRRAVQHGEATVVEELAASFEGSAISRAELARLVAGWRESSRPERPLGNLSLVCVVPVHGGWDHVLDVVCPYGIDLHAIYASVLLDEDNRSVAVSWYEIDPSAAKVELEPQAELRAAFQWDSERLRFLLDHPVARLEMLPSLVCRRSTRDLVVRLHARHGERETPVAAFTPMTGEQVLVEVRDSMRQDHWLPLLIGNRDQDELPAIARRLADAADRWG
jgi:hypothetical protein